MYLKNKKLPVRSCNGRREAISTKYVIAVANHLTNGVNIITDGFNAVEAKIILRQEVITLNLSLGKI